MRPHVRQAAEGDRADVDRCLPADGSRGPGRFEELIGGTGEVVRPRPDPLRVTEQHVCPGRHAVQQELHVVRPVEQRRRQRLHALDRDALGKLVQDLGELGVLGGQQRRLLPHGRGEQQLPAGRRPEPLDLLDGALVGDGEGADLLHLVAPELDPGRVLVGGREDVQDAAADRELAALGDQVDPCVRHVGQPPRDLLQLRLAAADQLHRLQVAEALELRLQQGPDGRDDHLERLVAGVGEPAQHGQALADRVRPRGEPLVRQRLPGRVDGDPLRIDQAAERVGQVVRLAGGRGDREHRALGAADVARAGHGGHHERTQRDRGGEVHRVGVDESFGRQVTGPGEATVAQGGRNQTGELHGGDPLRARRTTPVEEEPGVCGNSLVRPADTPDHVRPIAQHVRHADEAVVNSGPGEAPCVFCCSSALSTA